MFLLDVYYKVDDVDPLVNKFKLLTYDQPENLLYPLPIIDGVREPMSYLENLRPLLVLTMLGYASYRDLRTREVNDAVWLIFGALGLILDSYETLTGIMDPFSLVLPVVFVIIFSIVSGYLGLFGGADLLALVVLGILQPLAPRPPGWRDGS